ncbi:MAG TPA: MFS transporter [Gammaproteobacteria bacterium]|nr:MFS transporter [Gammaproteobacteria bacterium]
MNRTTLAPKIRSAIGFVIFMGLTSLFADMTYEGARSINGPFLAMLGASATVVGFVAGFGELAGYAVRFVSGVWCDRSGRYWPIVFIGYGINMLAVPALALAGHWPLAAALMILERVGKGIRKPVNDTMLSHATQAMGRGWGFGLHEAMDQAGATIGPLIVSAMLYFRHGFAIGYGVLLIPALLALAVLVTASRFYPRPRDLEVSVPKPNAQGVKRTYWLYLGASALVALGFADFPLIAFHFDKARVVSTAWIPVFFSVAMVVDGAAALLFGRLFDRLGLPLLAAITAVAWLFAPLVFFGGFYAALAGMVLWGIGMGAQESIMRAAVAEMAPPQRRGSAYGLFNAGFGIAWFCGSFLMGFLYDQSIIALVAFSALTQLAAVPLFLRLRAPA